MKTSNLDKEFVYNIIKHQIRSRVYESATMPIFEEDKAFEIPANVMWDTLVENGIMHIGRTKFPDIRWFAGWKTFPMIYADSLLIHHLFEDDYSTRVVS